jgi:hypothetical protein
MAEIYKFKKGETEHLSLRYVGDVLVSTDYMAQVATSNPSILFEAAQRTEFESGGNPIPTDRTLIRDFYENDPTFWDYINYLFTGALSRSIQNNDVIIFMDDTALDGAAFKYMDDRIVWDAKKGADEIYRIVKGTDLIFQRQYQHGYTAPTLSAFVSSTGTSITWRLYNKDQDVAADTYGAVAEGAVPSVDFSTGQKKGSLIAPNGSNTFTSTGLNDGSRYYCKGGLKHPTLKISPIMEDSYRIYDLPIAAPTVSIVSVDDSSATIKFTNNSSTKTIEIYAYVGTSVSGLTYRGNPGPGGYANVVFSGLSPSTTYNLYWYARYVEQEGTTGTSGT